MAHINIERAHELGKEEAKKRAEKMQAKLQEKYGVALTWKGDCADIKGKGVSGSFDVTEKALRLQLKLSIMLRPLKGKIQQSIERQLERALS